MNDIGTEDMRAVPPMWVRYIVYVNNHENSDKFYETRVDLLDSGRFQLTKRWGRRPDSGGGQVKRELHPTMAIACAQGTEIIRAKVSEGYRETPRPLSADAQVVLDHRPDFEFDSADQL